MQLSILGADRNPGSTRGGGEVQIPPGWCLGVISLVVTPAGGFVTEMHLRGLLCPLLFDQREGFTGAPQAMQPLQSYPLSRVILELAYCRVVTVGGSISVYLSGRSLASEVSDA